MIFYGLAEFLSKKYANTCNYKFALASILAYVVVSVLWLPSLQAKNSLAILSTVWTILYTIIGVFIGIFIFKEQLNAYNYVGIILALIALYFLCK